MFLRTSFAVFLFMTSASGTCKFQIKQLCPDFPADAYPPPSQPRPPNVFMRVLNVVTELDDNSKELDTKPNKHKILLRINDFPNPQKEDQFGHKIVIEIRAFKSNQPSYGYVEKMIVQAFKIDDYNFNVRASGADKKNRKGFSMDFSNATQDSKLSVNNANRIQFTIHGLEFSTGNNFNRYEAIDNRNKNRIVVDARDLRKLFNDNIKSDKRILIKVRLVKIKPSKPGRNVDGKSQMLIEIELITSDSRVDYQPKTTLKPELANIMDIPVITNEINGITKEPYVVARVLEVLTELSENNELVPPKSNRYMLIYLNDYTNPNRENKTGNVVVLEILALNSNLTSNDLPEKMTVQVFKNEGYDPEIRGKGAVNQKVEVNRLFLNLDSESQNANTNQIELKLVGIEFLTDDKFNQNKAADERNKNRIVLNPTDLKKLFASGRKIYIKARLFKVKPSKSGDHVNANSQILLEIEVSPDPKFTSQPETSLIPEQADDSVYSEFPVFDSEKKVEDIRYPSKANQPHVLIKLIKNLIDLDGLKVEKPDRIILFDISNLTKPQVENKSNKTVIMEVRTLNPNLNSSSIPEKLKIQVYKAEDYNYEMSSQGAVEKIRQEVLVIFNNATQDARTVSVELLIIGLKFSTVDNFNGNKAVDITNLYRIVLNSNDLKPLFGKNKQNGSNMFITARFLRVKPKAKLNGQILLQIDVKKEDLESANETIQYVYIFAPSNNIENGTKGSIADSPSLPPSSTESQEFPKSAFKILKQNGTTINKTLSTNSDIVFPAFPPKVPNPDNGSNQGNKNADEPNIYVILNKTLTVRSDNFKGPEDNKYKISFNLNDVLKNRDKEVIIEIRALRANPRSNDLFEGMIIQVIKDKDYNSSIRAEGANETSSNQLVLQLNNDNQDPRTVDNITIVLIVSALKFSTANDFNQPDKSNKNQIVFSPKDLKLLLPDGKKKNRNIPVQIHFVKVKPPKPPSKKYDFDGQMLIEIEVVKPHGDPAPTTKSPDLSNNISGNPLPEIKEIISNNSNVVFPAFPSKGQNPGNEPNIYVIVSKHLSEMNESNTESEDKKYTIWFNLNDVIKNKDEEVIIEIRSLKPNTTSNGLPQEMIIQVIRKKDYNPIRIDGVIKNSSNQVQLQLNNENQDPRTDDNNTIVLKINALQFAKANDFNRTEAAKKPKGNQIVLNSNDIKPQLAGGNKNNSDVLIKIHFVHLKRAKSDKNGNANSEMFIKIQVITPGSLKSSNGNMPTTGNPNTASFNNSQTTSSGSEPPSTETSPKQSSNSSKNPQPSTPANSAKPPIEIFIINGTTINKALSNKSDIVFPAFPPKEPNPGNGINQDNKNADEPNIYVILNKTLVVRNENYKGPEDNKYKISFNLNDVLKNRDKEVIIEIRALKPNLRSNDLFEEMIIQVITNKDYNPSIRTKGANETSSIQFLLRFNNEYQDPRTVDNNTTVFTVRALKFSTAHDFNQTGKNNKNQIVLKPKDLKPLLPNGNKKNRNIPVQIHFVKVKPLKPRSKYDFDGQMLIEIEVVEPHVDPAPTPPPKQPEISRKTSNNSDVVFPAFPSKAQNPGNEPNIYVIVSKNLAEMNQSNKQPEDKKYTIWFNLKDVIKNKDKEVIIEIRALKPNKTSNGLPEEMIIQVIRNKDYNPMRTIGANKNSSKQLLLQINNENPDPRTDDNNTIVLKVIALQFPKTNDFNRTEAANKPKGNQIAVNSNDIKPQLAGGNKNNSDVLIKVHLVHLKPEKPGKKGNANNEMFIKIEVVTPGLLNSSNGKTATTRNPNTASVNNSQTTSPGSETVPQLVFKILEKNVTTLKPGLPDGNDIEFSPLPSHDNEQGFDKTAREPKVIMRLVKNVTVRGENDKLPKEKNKIFLNINKLTKNKKNTVIIEIRALNPNFRSNDLPDIIKIQAFKIENYNICIRTKGANDISSGRLLLELYTENQDSGTTDNAMIELKVIGLKFPTVDSFNRTETVDKTNENQIVLNQKDLKQLFADKSKSGSKVFITTRFVQIKPLKSGKKDDQMFVEIEVITPSSSDNSNSDGIIEVQLPPSSSNQSNDQTYDFSVLPSKPGQPNLDMRVVQGLVQVAEEPQENENKILFDISDDINSHLIDKFGKKYIIEIRTLKSKLASNSLPERIEVQVFKSDDYDSVMRGEGAVDRKDLLLNFNNDDKTAGPLKLEVKTFEFDTLDKFNLNKAEDKSEKKIVFNPKDKNNLFISTRILNIMSSKVGTRSKMLIEIEVTEPESIEQPYDSDFFPAFTYGNEANEAVDGNNTVMIKIIQTTMELENNDLPIQENRFTKLVDISDLTKGHENNKFVLEIRTLNPKSTLNILPEKMIIQVFDIEDYDAPMRYANANRPKQHEVILDYTGTEDSKTLVNLTIFALEFESDDNFSEYEAKDKNNKNRILLDSKDLRELVDDNDEQNSKIYIKIRLVKLNDQMLIGIEVSKYQEDVTSIETETDNDSGKNFKDIFSLIKKTGDEILGRSEGVKNRPTRGQEEGNIYNLTKYNVLIRLLNETRELSETKNQLKKHKNQILINLNDLASKFGKKAEMEIRVLNANRKGIPERMEIYLFKAKDYNSLARSKDAYETKSYNLRGYPIKLNIFGFSTDDSFHKADKNSLIKIVLDAKNLKNLFANNGKIIVQISFINYLSSKPGRSGEISSQFIQVQVLPMNSDHQSSRFQPPKYK